MKRKTVKERALEIVRDYDDTLKKGSRHYNVALLLAGSCVYGPKMAALSEKLGIKRSVAARIAATFERNGIWEDGGVCLGYERDADIGISFALSVAVGLGLLKRVLKERIKLDKKMRRKGKRE